MSEVVVHFNAKREGGGRRLVAVSLKGVGAVVIGEEAKASFLSARDSEGKPLAEFRPLSAGEVPPQLELKVVLENEEMEGTRLRSDEDGPQDVCYWINGQLFCWE